MYDDYIFYAIALCFVIGALVGFVIEKTSEEDTKRFDQCVSAGMQFVDGDCVDK